MLYYLLFSFALEPLLPKKLHTKSQDKLDRDEPERERKEKKKEKRNSKHQEIFDKEMKTTEIQLQPTEAVILSETVLFLIFFCSFFCTSAAFWNHPLLSCSSFLFLSSALQWNSLLIFMVEKEEEWYYGVKTGSSYCGLAHIVVHLIYCGFLDLHISCYFGDLSSFFQCHQNHINQNLKGWVTMNFTEDICAPKNLSHLSFYTLEFCSIKSN